MESASAENKLLKDKYGLHKERVVIEAAKRRQEKTGEKVPQDPLFRIQNYLDRFKGITECKDLQQKEQRIKDFKKVMFDKFVTKAEEVPESYWQLQERAMWERGQGGDFNRFSEKQLEEARKQQTERVLEDQKASLEQWIDYFTSEQSAHISLPMKYWTFRNILNLQEYDKEKQEFPQRSRGTVKMFPDVNSKALDYVVNAMTTKYQGRPFVFDEKFEYDLNPEQKEKFQKSLSQENFVRLYAWANENIAPISSEELKITEGKWVKYEKDSSHLPLVESIRGRGTGWCTAGEFTAKTQLKTGDFYIFYSNDEKGNPIHPRIAIRMQGNNIAEVRGISYKQNLDPYMNDVLAKKLEEFPDKELYLKKEQDMKYLTEIENKIKNGETLMREDLIFLYEVNSKIQGFGQERDPRIKELKIRRNTDEDILTILNFEKTPIAHNINEINENTKLYVGPLINYDKEGKIIPIFRIFQKYGIENVYTEFPEGKISFEKITIGGKNSKKLQKEMKDKEINIHPFVKDVINSRKFTTLKNQKNLTLARLRIKDLGLKSSTINEAYTRALELGLALCPAEVGPHRRLQDLDQIDSPYKIAMLPIVGQYDHTLNFLLHSGDNGLWLDYSWTALDSPICGANDDFMFCLNKSASSKDEASSLKPSFFRKFFRLFKN